MLRIILGSIMSAGIWWGLYAEAEEITVVPGKSIQKALDKLSKTGGIVTLKAGVHKVSSSLLIHSNIILQGELARDRTKVVIVPGKEGMNQPLITNNKPIHNVIIRNLTIRGDLRDEEKRYPAEYLRNKNIPMRTGLLGIFFNAGGDSYETAQNQNITIDNVEVINCSMGIHIKGSRDVTLSRLNLHDNGMIKKYFHNMYLRRVFNVFVKDSIFYDSPTGCGINISQSGDVHIENCEARDNFWRGIRIYGEKGWIVKGIHVAGNRCLNNGDAGFLLCNIEGGEVLDNIAQYNRAGNLRQANLRGVDMKKNKF
ncbi:MAG: hypothetical protein D6820_11280 [Lentisphaerae bacterium]|nr:MAG: hypothetical protein D6820_11280 [Lentisphaerota bacterium]